jgi:hypothetical protein
LYGCKIWSLTLLKENKLRVFDNRLLRCISGLKRDEIVGGWRKLHKEKLYYLYSLTNIIRMIKSRRIIWAGHVACMGENRNTYRVLVGNPEGKRQLGRSRCRWVDNIKMDLRDAGWGGMDLIHLAQDRELCGAPVKTILNLWAP